MLLIWVVGSQVFILAILIKYRHQLNNPKVKRYFQLLYQGYRTEVFYWEFVNTLRKVLLVSINVFLSQYPLAYKGMSAVTLLVILYRFQIWLKPYKLKVNNEIENLSMVAIGFTIFGGLLFLGTNSEVIVIEVLTFILIIVINLVFFLFWIYLMSKTYEHYAAGKKVATVLKILLFRGENDTVFTSSSDFRQGSVKDYKNASKRVKYTNLEGPKIKEEKKVAKKKKRSKPKTQLNISDLSMSILKRPWTEDQRRKGSSPFKFKSKFKNKEKVKLPKEEEKVVNSVSSDSSDRNVKDVTTLMDHSLWERRQNLPSSAEISEESKNLPKRFMIEGKNHFR